MWDGALGSIIPTKAEEHSLAGSVGTRDAGEGPGNPHVCRFCREGAEQGLRERQAGASRQVVVLLTVSCFSLAR